jgi:hypothetical protein
MPRSPRLASSRFQAFVAQHGAHFCGICSKSSVGMSQVATTMHGKAREAKGEIDLRAKYVCSFVLRQPPTHGEILSRLPAITINGTVARDN